MPYVAMISASYTPLRYAVFMKPAPIRLRCRREHGEFRDPLRCRLRLNQFVSFTTRSSRSTHSHLDCARRKRGP